MKANKGFITTKKHIYSPLERFSNIPCYFDKIGLEVCIVGVCFTVAMIETVKLNLIPENVPISWEPQVDFKQQ